MKKLAILAILFAFACLANMFVWATVPSIQAGCIKRIEQGQHLNPYQVGSIYSLHLAACAAGVFVAPETANESFQLLWKHGDREWHNDFFVRPDIIRAKHVGLTYTWKDLRIGTALNGQDVCETDSTYYVTGTMQYPYLSQPTVFFGKIYVTEGLFYYLQQIGLMHPYKFTYIASK